MTLLGTLLKWEGVTACPETRLPGSSPARLGLETKRTNERRPMYHGGGVCGDRAGCMIDLRQVGVAEGGQTDCDDTTQDHAGLETTKLPRTIFFFADKRIW